MAKGKYPKKKDKKPIALTVAIVVLLLLVFVGLSIFIIPQWLYTLGDESETLPDRTGSSQAQGTDHESSSAETVPGQTVSFPVTVADGELEISCLYPYSGINPDCSNQAGNDIAAITVKNISDVYLSEGSITLTLSDGATANFKVADLPAGKTVMAFSTDNTVLAADSVCVDVACEAVFDSEASMSADIVSVSADGMSVTLTNVSGRKLKKVVVYCHNILEPDYFGGITYIYSIEKLAAGASITVDAVDCILGLAEVVRIDAE